MQAALLGMSTVQTTPALPVPRAPTALEAPWQLTHSPSSSHALKEWPQQASEPCLLCSAVSPALRCPAASCHVNYAALCPTTASLPTQQTRVESLPCTTGDHTAQCPMGLHHQPPPVAAAAATVGGAHW